MRNIVIDFPKVTPVHKYYTELVERKGIGHPDSICDGLAEAVSVALSREYKRRFGRVYHHNTDQVELVGGEAHPRYGGGDFIEPIYILLSGRATAMVGNEKVPTGMIAVKAAKEYLKQNFRNLDVDSEVKIDHKIGKGSADLTHVFEQKGIPKSNDTSFGVGYAPLSTLERLVLKTDQYIYKGLGMKETGEDTKVMGVRNGDKITLTVACAIVSKYIDDLDAYISTIQEMHSKLMDYACKQTDKEVEIHINTADKRSKPDESVYITMTGLSAEGGDDGSVGRGNRANGLITPYRPMSLEATSGKNPINHVGKIYNLLSKEIAEDIAEAGAEQVHVRLLSQIGKPIDEPLIASIEIVGDKALESKAKQITDRWLEDIGEITRMCMEGKACTF